METLYECAKHLFTQGMEVDNPDSRESEPEDGQPDNEAAKMADGEEEDEEGFTGEEQQENTDEEDWHTCSEDEGTSRSSGEPSFHNSSRLLYKDELLDMFKAAHKGSRCKDGQLTVGLVGKTSALYIPPQKSVLV